ncbi:sigma-70 family RNA polymerase sigma factor [Paraburkholderia strydomiana]|uniref:sigma-70 family RNA polymerase sigma factor n=1 Tax=Paraburkholderia strydomiana TaxID=1245417 RepID=UPI001BE5CEDC|nr:sigma-70 family RNA polymerase sigma factor [Paraburkholderia strydomiana]MBT2791008.1 sigma-70 family RNA polymerase sigma factor [Paraburkholderia strydomiana]
MTEHEIDKASSFGAVRARLIALAYRMLGSRAEAEDIVQDVWLKWHLADTHEVQTPAAWLTTLTTRTAIDRLRNVQRERESQTTGWLPEPWLDEVAPSAEELALRAAEMSYGVMLLLERLKPDERAAFVLHEAFDCDYAEIGKILERTPASCRQIVHRARVRLQRAGAPLQKPDAQAHARIVERFRSALEAQDRASLLDLFSDTPVVVSDEPEFGALNVVASSPAPLVTPLVAPPVTRGGAEAVTKPSGVPAQAIAQAPACEHESTFGDWIEKVTSLAGQASHVELVSVGGVPSIAFLIEGDVVALIDVSTEDPYNSLTSAERRSQAQGPVCNATNSAQKIVSLHAVTSASRLRAANRVLGRAAVSELLTRITRNPAQSVAMGRDFPIDVYA